VEKIFNISIALVFLLSYGAYAKEVSFTQEDRDRLIRLDERLTGLEKSVNQRIAGLEKSVNQRIEGLEKTVNQRIEGLEKTVHQRIDDVRNLIYIVISGILGLIVVVIWDRRSALAPAIRKSKELEEREELLEKALKEYARQEPRLAEIFKSMKIMQS
jgi:chaperonin cofactor prefoldin